MTRYQFTGDPQAPVRPMTALEVAARWDEDERVVVTHASRAPEVVATVAWVLQRETGHLPTAAALADALAEWQALYRFRRQVQRGM